MFKSILKVGLCVFFALLILSCVAVVKSHSYIGTWNHQPGTFTYINEDKGVQLTFPSDRWRVFTKPHKDMQDWMEPEAGTYHILIAREQDLGLVAQVIIEPVTGDISLDDYVKLGVGQMQQIFSQAEGINFQMIDSEATKRKGRPMGLVAYTVTNQRFLTIIFKEKGRFTILTFNCLGTLFESKQDIFWSIVDSYECLE